MAATIVKINWAGPLTIERTRWSIDQLTFRFNWRREARRV